jgi:hypothetical protein
VTGGTAGTRRGPFDVDQDRALDALRLEWGSAYAVCYDSAPGIKDRWRAWRLDGDETMLAGETPDELAAAIRADWATRSTR